MLDRVEVHCVDLRNCTILGNALLPDSHSLNPAVFSALRLVGLHMLTRSVNSGLYSRRGLPFDHRARIVTILLECGEPCSLVVVTRNYITN